LTGSAEVKKSTGAIRILKDLSSDTLEEALPSTESEIVELYPLQKENMTKTNQATNRRQQEYRLAAVLYHLCKDIQVAKSQEIQALNEDFDSAKKAFDAAKNVSVPSLDASSIVWPELGPLEAFKEPLTAPYQRCNVVLRSLSSVLAPSKWKSTFDVKKGDPYRLTCSRT
jgi:hypothetical protein